MYIVHDCGDDINLNSVVSWQVSSSGICEHAFSLASVPTVVKVSISVVHVKNLGCILPGHSSVLTCHAPIMYRNVSICLWEMGSHM